MRAIQTTGEPTQSEKFSKCLTSAIAEESLPESTKAVSSPTIE